MNSEYTKRFNPTNAIGMSIFEKCISKELGWICRDIAQSDMGIDFNIEQVISGIPTAKYISVQLKTGFGNVYTDNNNNFIYYIKPVHYDYWLSSSIPVILALCDPDKEIIYWEIIKKSNIQETPKGYKIEIKHNKILSNVSVEELSGLIDTYQSDFQLPEIEDMEEMSTNVEYWTELLSNCSESIANSTNLFNQLDKKYQEVNRKMSEWCSKHSEGNVEQIIVNRDIRNRSRSLGLAINICRTQFKSIIPTITKTHIEAIRLIKFAVDNSEFFLNKDISAMIKKELLAEKTSLESNIRIFTEGVQQYKKGNRFNVNLGRAEYSFSLVLEDYCSNLKELNIYINWLIGKLDSL